AASSAPWRQSFVVLLRSTKTPGASQVLRRLFGSLFQAADQTFWLRGAVAPAPRLWLTLPLSRALSLAHPQFSVSLLQVRAAAFRSFRRDAKYKIRPQSEQDRCSAPGPTA